MYIICCIFGIASEVWCFVSDREVITQESVTSQSGNRTSVQTAAGSIINIHTTAGESEIISTWRIIVIVVKQQPLTVNILSCRQYVAFVGVLFLNLFKT